MLDRPVLFGLHHIRSFVIVSVVAGRLAAPASAQWFTDRTAELFPAQQEYTNQVTVVDVDADGDRDIVWANGGGFSAAEAPLPARLFINRLDEPAGVFADESASRLGNLVGIFRDVQAGDCDGDGDPDLIFAQDFLRPAKLLLNDGAGNFSDASAERLPAMNLSSNHVAFADVDNDGDLDLFFCNGGAYRQLAGVPQLFLNNGSGLYVDAPASMTPQAAFAGQMDCTFADIDGDFDLDVVLSGLVGTSQLWRNNGSGAFTKLLPFNGGQVAYSHDFGDLDGDGDLDLIGVSALPEYLIRNNMPGAWADVSALISPNITIDDNESRFFDYDDDGDGDLIIATLEFGVTARTSVERVYRNDGPGATPQFVEQAGVMPLGKDATLDLEVADLNGDGRLDVVTAQGEFGADFQNRIYMNETGPADSHAPTIVRVESVANATLVAGSAGPFAIRAIVTDATTGDRGFDPQAITLDVVLADGGRMAIPMRWVGNTEWRGVIPPQQTCGTISYRLVATDRSNNTATSATASFVITSSTPVLGDVDGDCIVGSADVAILLGAWGTANEAADLDGDGAVTAGDLAILIGAWTS